MTNAITSATTVIEPRTTPNTIEQRPWTEPAVVRRGPRAAGPGRRGRGATCRVHRRSGGARGQRGRGRGADLVWCSDLTLDRARRRHAGLARGGRGRGPWALGSARSETPHWPQKEWLGVALPQLAHAMSGPMGISSDSWSRPRWMIRRSQSDATTARTAEHEQLNDLARDVRIRDQDLDGGGCHEQRSGEDRRHDGAAQRAEQVLVLVRAAIAQPHDANEPADGAGRDDRHRHPERQQTHDPGQDVAPRLEAGSEQVQRGHDGLGAHEGDRGCDAEGGAIEDVVEAPLGQQNQRPDRHEDAGDERHDHPAGKVEARCAAFADGTATDAARRLGRQQLVEQEREHAAGQRPPQEGEGHDADRLILIGVHVVQVDDRDDGHQDGRRHDRDREEAQGAQAPR